MAKVLALPEKERIGALVFDVDKTLYCGSRGEEYLEDGTKGELEFLCGYLGLGSIEETKEVLMNKRKEIGNGNGNGLGSVSHAVYAFGVTMGEWNCIRCGCFKPETFFAPNTELRELLSGIPCGMAAATNSPRGVGERVLEAIGLGRLMSAGRIKVFGPEDFGVSKPDPRVYAKVAELLRVDAGLCVSLGDHEYKDCTMALKAGFGGAVHVRDTHDLIQFLRCLYGK